jgi:hypothetical protein
MSKGRIIWEISLIVMIIIFSMAFLPYVEIHTEDVESAITLVGGGGIGMLLLMFLIDNTIKGIKKQ